MGWGGRGLWEGSFWCGLFTWVDVCCGNTDSQWVSRGVLKDFTEDALHFVPEWDRPNGKSVLATNGTTSLLVEHIGVAA